MKKKNKRVLYFPRITISFPADPKAKQNPPASLPLQ